jgi:hypothetical protein
MKNLPWLVIVGLLAIILLQRVHCGGSDPVNTAKIDTVVKIDTFYITKDTVIKKKIFPVRVDTLYDTSFVPNPNYDSLKVQYEELAKDFLLRRIYRDSLTLDSFGYVLVIDTVRYNKLFDREYKYHYELPIVSKQVDIIKPTPKKGQLYLGGGVAGTKTSFQSVQGGLLFKTKNDKIIGGFVGVGADGNIFYGVQSYWKIRFKR